MKNKYFIFYLLIFSISYGKIYKFESLGIFKKDISVIHSEKGDYVIDGNGNTLIKANYMNIEILNNKFLYCTSNNYSKIIDSTGKVYLSGYYKMKNSSKYYNYYILEKKIRNSIKYSMLNSSFKEVLGYNFDDFKEINENLIAFKKDKFWTLYNTKGEQINDYLIEEISNNNSKNFAVRVDNKWGILNSKGKLITELKYEDLYRIDNDYFAGYYNNHWFIINSSDSFLVSINVDLFNNVLDETNIIVEYKNKYGIIDKYGNEVIPTNYDMIFKVNKSDYFIVFNKNVPFLFDKKGNFIKEIKNYTSIVNNQYFEFEDNMKKGLLNQNGEPFLPPIFSDIIPCNDLSIIIKKDNRYGLLNPDGDLILMPEYKNIIYLDPNYIKMDSNYFAIQKNDKYILINNKGNVVSDIQYSFNELKNIQIYENFLFDKYNLIDLNSKKIISSSAFSHIELSDFKYSNIARIKNGKNIGYYDRIKNKVFYVK